MLGGMDKGLALISWVAAGIVVVMLFAGPRIVAHDDQKQTPAAKGASPYAQPASASEDTGAAVVAKGKALFADNCAGCHNKDASGAVGPNIQGFDIDRVKNAMKTGPGAMPTFNLPAADADAIASFVSSL